MVRTGVFMETHSGEECASKLTYQWAGFSFLNTVGLRTSFPVDDIWKLFSVLCHVGIFIWQPVSSKPMREPASKMEVRVFCNLVKEVTSLQYWDVLSWLELNDSVGGDYIGALILGDGIIGTIRVPCWWGNNNCLTRLSWRLEEVILI